MTIAAHLLIDDLIARTQANSAAVREFEKLSDNALNWKPAQESWSVLACIEHLNMYGDFYLPEIERNIQEADKQKVPANFKSGLFGNYFAKSMLPQEKSKKMKTFKDKDPGASQLDRSVLDRFMDQQKVLLSLLDEARTVDLTKVKTPMSISRLLKLRLGDTFRVLVYHNQRHIVQAKKVVAQMGEQEGSQL